MILCLLYLSVTDRGGAEVLNYNSWLIYFSFCFYLFWWAIIKCTYIWIVKCSWRIYPFNICNAAHYPSYFSFFWSQFALSEINIDKPAFKNTVNMVNLPPSLYFKTITVFIFKVISYRNHCYYSQLKSSLVYVD